MPRYIVTETRSFIEKWLIEAEDEEQAQLRNGEILEEMDHGWHDSVLESLESEQVEDGRRYL